MSPDGLFSIVNLVALAAWLLLAVFPRRQPVAIVIPAVVAALLAGIYIALLVANWGGPGGFSSLDAVGRLFSNPWLLLAGWVHYLAFDLLVGSWEARDAHARGVPHWAVVPCLALTFVFGPAGWLLYVGVRRVPFRREKGAGPGW